MEAIGEGESEVVGVSKAAEEAADAVQPPEGIEFHLDTEPELAA